MKRRKAVELMKRTQLLVIGLAMLLLAWPARAEGCACGETCVWVPNSNPGCVHQRDVELPRERATLETERGGLLSERAGLVSERASLLTEKSTLLAEKEGYRATHGTDDPEVLRRQAAAKKAAADTAAGTAKKRAQEIAKLGAQIQDLFAKIQALQAQARAACLGT